MTPRIFPTSATSQIILVLASYSLGLTLLAVNVETRHLLLPIAASLLIALWFWLSLTERRGKIPIDDIGMITALAILCYTVLPPLQLLLSGMQYTEESALPFYVLTPTAAELGGFTWWYVVYLLAFVVAYLLFDSHQDVERVKTNPPDRTTVVVFVLLLTALSAAMVYIAIVYQIDYGGVYDEHLADSYAAFLGMPLVFRQVFGIAQFALVIIKVALLLTIFLNWEKIIYRYILYAWLTLLVLTNALRMGSRTEMILLLLAAAIFHHRFVTPLKLKQALLVGFIVFSVFIIMGVMRGTATLSGNLKNLTSTVSDSQNMFAINTEFQALFAGNYDLLRMKKTGDLKDLPLQFRLYELSAIIPQQILPFQKLDIQDWVMSRSENSGAFMFSPISQSIIGFGFVELVVRAGLLSLFFAKFRAWYLARKSRFWPTLLYFYILLTSFNTIRTTAFYILTVSIFFRFLPLYLLIRLLTRGRTLAKPFNVNPLTAH